MPRNIVLLPVTNAERELLILQKKPTRGIPLPQNPQKHWQLRCRVCKIPLFFLACIRNFNCIPRYQKKITRHSFFFQGVVHSMDGHKSGCSDVQSSSWCGQLKAICDCTCNLPEPPCAISPCETTVRPGNIKTRIFGLNYGVEIKIS